MFMSFVFINNTNKSEAANNWCAGGLTLSYLFKE